MSPENYRVVSYENPRKKGVRVEKLYIDQGVSFEERVEAVAQHFKADREQIMEVLEEEKEIISVYQKGEHHKRKGAKPYEESYMMQLERRLKGLGISAHHAERLVVGMVEHLAEEKGEPDFEDWQRRREEMLKILFKKTREIEPEYLTAITGEKIKPIHIRNDVSDKLGEPLTMRERQLYGLLLKSGDKPVSSEEIYRKIWNDSKSGPDRGERVYIQIIVHRLRAKLGEEAIITKPGEGYLARSELIKKQVERNRGQKRQEENKG